VVEVADVDALAFIGGGLLVEPVPAAATYAAHEPFSLQLFAEIISEVYIEPAPVRTDCSHLWGFLREQGKWSLLPEPPLRASSDVNIRTHFAIDVSI
jgi:hypothetical protein